MRCVHCDTTIRPDGEDAYCHTCYCSLNDEHDKVRAVESSLEELERLQANMELWADDAPTVKTRRVGEWATRLRKIIEDNKEAWGL